MLKFPIPKAIFDCWRTLKIVLIIAYIVINPVRIRRALALIPVFLGFHKRSDVGENLTESNVIAADVDCMDGTEGARRTNQFKAHYIAYLHLFRYLRNSIKCHYVFGCLGYNGAIGSHILSLIGIAWICQKLDLNLKIVNSDSCLFEIFENSTLYYSEPHKSVVPLSSPESITHQAAWQRAGIPFVGLTAGFAEYEIASEFGHTVLTKLAIKCHLQQQADQWYSENIKGKCIGVHYRGTDSYKLALSYGGGMKIETYVTYLKKVLDKSSCIFVCSDQAQFISRMKSVFPGRVVARNIKRSYTGDPIHFDGGSQQTRDAFIDILILAKTGLVFQSGSNYANLVRFINPHIKIISAGHRKGPHSRIKHIPNYIFPIPKRDFFDHYRK